MHVLAVILSKICHFFIIWRHAENSYSANQWGMDYHKPVKKII